MKRREPITERGRETKGRIVEVAARLMFERGVDATTLDDILAAAGAGKSQFYHYFARKEDVVAAVLKHQAELVLGEQAPFPLDTFDGISAWFDAMIASQERRGTYRGCPLGSIVAEVAERDERLREVSMEAFDRWGAQLRTGLASMRERGALRRDADPLFLAEATMASVQGGYLLAVTHQDTQPMRSALAAALALIRSHASQ